MKKTISLIIVAVMCLSLFACGSNHAESKVPTEVDITQFPDAYEFDVFEWPSFGMGTMLPTAMWSNRGVILKDTENLVWMRVGYTTSDDYAGYIKTCQKAGFTENYFKTDYLYYAENSEGYSIKLVHWRNDTELFIDIKITNDTSDWDMWWLK